MRDKPGGGLQGWRRNDDEPREGEAGEREAGQDAHEGQGAGCQERIQNFLRSRMIQHPGIWTIFCQTQQEKVEFIWKKGVIQNKNKVEEC